MARAAYNTEKYSEDYSKQGFEIDHGLSDSHRVVFFNPGTKKAVVSFRGTKLTDFGDLYTDYKVLKGEEGNSKRFMNSTYLTRTVVHKYGKENVSLTGHSLGGTQAVKIGQELGLQSHAFNPGIGPKTGIVQALGKLTKKKNAHKNVTIYHTGLRDPISALSPLMQGRVKHVGPRFHSNAHGIDNFIF